MIKFFLSLVLLISCSAFAKGVQPTEISCGVGAGDLEVFNDLHETRPFNTKSFSIQKFNKEVEYIVHLRRESSDVARTTTIYLILEIKDLITGQWAFVEESFTEEDGLSLINKTHTVGIHNQRGGLLGRPGLREISLGCFIH